MLLDFRKTENKNKNLSFVEANINDLLEDTYIRFCQLIEDRQLHFDIYRPLEEIKAYIDLKAIRKVINLSST